MRDLKKQQQTRTDVIERKDFHTDCTLNVLDAVFSCGSYLNFTDTLVKRLQAHPSHSLSSSVVSFTEKNEALQDIASKENR